MQTQDQFSLTSNYAKYIMDKLEDGLLFENPSSATKEEITKITDVFQKFLEKKKLEIENLTFSERVKGSLTKIHQLYQIEHCSFREIKQQEFPKFCNLVDECISNKIECFKKKNLRKRKIDEVQKFSEELRLESKKYIVGIVPEESLERGYTSDWLDTYSFASEEEVRFIFRKWNRVDLITEFIGQFSFSELMGLEGSCRKFMLDNVDNVISLLNFDKELTCVQLMEAEKDIRNYIVSYGEELSFLISNINRALTPHATISIKDLTTCSLKQLSLILNYKPQLQALLALCKVPFKKLLAFDEKKLEQLLGNFHSESSRQFLDEYTESLKLTLITDEEFEEKFKLLNNEDKNKIKFYCMEIMEILSIFEIELSYLFQEENKKIMDLAIENIWRIKPLLNFETPILSHQVHLILKEAIKTVNGCAWDEFEIIESFSETIRWNILQDYHAFNEKVKELDRTFEDLKELSFETLKQMGLFDHIDEQDVIHVDDSSE